MHETTSEPLSLRVAAEEHYEHVYRFAFSLTRTPNDASDLVQSAFLKLAKNRSQILDVSRLRSWLFTTVRREFIDQKRRGTKFPNVEYTPEMQEEDSSCADQAETTADANSLVQSLLSMEEPFREVLSLHYLKGLTYREMAAILEVPTGTIMSRLARGREKLRERFESGRNQLSDA